MRDAYTLFDQVASFSEENITMQKIQEKLGLTSLDSISSLLSFCALGNAKEAINTFNDILQNGVSIEQFITDLASYLRALLLVKQGIEKEALLGFNKERLSKDVLNAWNENQIEIAFSIMLQLYKDVRFSISQRFEAELAISRISTLKDYVAPSELKLIFNAAKSMLENGGSIEDGSFSKIIASEKKKPEIDDGFNSTFKISVNHPFISSSKEPQKKKIEVSEEVHEVIKVNSVKELKEIYNNLNNEEVLHKAVKMLSSKDFQNLKLSLFKDLDNTIDDESMKLLKYILKICNYIYNHTDYQGFPFNRTFMELKRSEIY